MEEVAAMERRQAMEEMDPEGGANRQWRHQGVGGSQHAAGDESGRTGTSGGASQTLYGA